MFKNGQDQNSIKEWACKFTDESDLKDFKIISCGYHWWRVCRSGLCPFHANLCGLVTGCFSRYE